ncbi:hypothetical protein CGMCC3_g5188 [Colletotrichum fructicola]|nr:uncharacterized protein CGMCC3_g5188 [Colletotrichum fructicola]KAE9579050.1 hypothetical protein CGMCC3_g5188 [Colletotrichum fructicola]
MQGWNWPVVRESSSFDKAWTLPFQLPINRWSSRRSRFLALNSGGSFHLGCLDSLTLLDDK